MTNDDIKARVHILRKNFHADGMGDKTQAALFELVECVLCNLNTIAESQKNMSMAALLYGNGVAEHLESIADAARTFLPAEK